jgi:hypothetical protein
MQWPTLRYYPGMRLEILGKSTKNASHDSRSQCRDLNPRPPVYEGVETTRSQQWVRSLPCGSSIQEIPRIYEIQKPIPVAERLRCRSAAAWLLESRVRISLRAWMFVSGVYMLCCPV